MSKSTHKVTDEDKRKIWERYNNPEVDKTNSKIGEEFDISRNSVRYWGNKDKKELFDDDDALPDFLSDNGTNEETEEEDTPEVEETEESEEKEESKEEHPIEQEKTGNEGTLQEENSPETEGNYTPASNYMTGIDKSEESEDTDDITEEVKKSLEKSQKEKAEGVAEDIVQSREDSEDTIEDLESELESSKPDNFEVESTDADSLQLPEDKNSQPTSMDSEESEKPEGEQLQPPTPTADKGMTEAILKLPKQFFPLLARMWGIEDYSNDDAFTEEFDEGIQNSAEILAPYISKYLKKQEQIKLALGFIYLASAYAPAVHSMYQMKQEQSTQKTEQTEEETEETEEETEQDDINVGYDTQNADVDIAEKGQLTGD